MINDLKKLYPHFFSVKNPSRVFKLSQRLSHDCPAEKVSYYTGKIFKTVLFKDFMAGYPVFFLARTKVTGSAIHTRKKK